MRKHGCFRIKAGSADEFAKFGCKIRRCQEAMVTKQFGVFPVQFLKFIQPMRSDFVDRRQTALGVLTRPHLSFIGLFRLRNSAHGRDRE